MCLLFAEVRKCLYALFGQFGKVLEVVCFGTERLRGKAWVAFSDIAAAVDALRSLQGFPFCDKPMVGERNAEHPASV